MPGESVVALLCQNPGSGRVRVGGYLGVEVEVDAEIKIEIKVQVEVGVEDDAQIWVRPEFVVLGIIAAVASVVVVLGNNRTWNDSTNTTCCLPNADKFLLRRWTLSLLPMYSFLPQ